jgi:hypothetical protein
MVPETKVMTKTRNLMKEAKLAERQRKREEWRRLGRGVNWSEVLIARIHRARASGAWDCICEACCSVRQEASRRDRQAKLEAEVDQTPHNSARRLRAAKTSALMLERDAKFPGPGRPRAKR